MHKEDVIMTDGSGSMITSSSRVFLIYPENRSFLLRKTIRPAFRERSRLLITKLLLLFVGSLIGLLEPLGLAKIFLCLEPAWLLSH